MNMYPAFCACSCAVLGGCTPHVFLLHSHHKGGNGMIWWGNKSRWSRKKPTITKKVGQVIKSLNWVKKDNSYSVIDEVQTSNKRATERSLAAIKARARVGGKTSCGKEMIEREDVVKVDYQTISYNQMDRRRYSVFVWVARAGGSIRDPITRVGETVEE